MDEGEGKHRGRAQLVGDFLGFNCVGRIEENIVLEFHQLVFLIKRDSDNIKNHKFSNQYHESNMGWVWHHSVIIVFLNIELELLLRGDKVIECDFIDCGIAFLLQRKVLNNLVFERFLVLFGPEVEKEKLGLELLGNCEVEGLHVVVSLVFDRKRALEASVLRLKITGTLDILDFHFIQLGQAERSDPVQKQQNQKRL